MEDLAAIKRAMLSEKEGQQFYILAAAQAENQEAKEAFQQIADEEAAHFEWLKGLYNSLKGDKALPYNLDGINPPPGPNFFTWEKAGPEKGAMGVTVFAIAMKLEKEAVDFYKQAAENSTANEVKMLFNILSKWEGQHYQAFKAEHDRLQDEWWQDQGFEPF